MTHAAYLDQLVECSAGQPMVGQPIADQPLVSQPVVGQPLVGQPVVGQPLVSLPVTGPLMVGQPSCPIPPLLSLRIQPDLNALAQTLSPQALQYVHLGIQISHSLLN